MILGTLKIYSYKINNDTVIISFNNKLSDKIRNFDRVVFDVVKMKFRESIIDDLKTIKLTKMKTTNLITCGLRFPDGRDKIGLYEVELSECGVWLEMYKINENG